MVVAPAGEPVGVRSKRNGIEGEERWLKVPEVVDCRQERTVGRAMGGGGYRLMAPVEAHICEAGDGVRRDGGTGGL